MRPVVLGAAALSATTASASALVVSLGSCSDASKQTVFELSTGINTPLPANGGPFCSVSINSVSSDLVKDTAQCLAFAGNAQAPIDVASSLGGPYIGSTPLNSILCSANSAAQPSLGSQPVLARRRLDAPAPTPTNLLNKRQQDDPGATGAPIADFIPINYAEKRDDRMPTSSDGDDTTKDKARREARPEPTAGPLEPAAVDKREAEAQFGGGYPTAPPPKGGRHGNGKREAEPQINWGSGYPTAPPPKGGRHGNGKREAEAQINWGSGYPTAPPPGKGRHGNNKLRDLVDFVLGRKRDAQPQINWGSGYPTAPPPKGGRHGNGKREAEPQINWGSGYPTAPPPKGGRHGNGKREAEAEAQINWGSGYPTAPPPKGGRGNGKRQEPVPAPSPTPIGIPKRHGSKNKRDVEVEGEEDVEKRQQRELIFTDAAASNMKGLSGLVVAGVAAVVGVAVML